MGILSNFDVRSMIKKAFAVCLAQVLRMSFSWSYY